MFPDGKSFMCMVLFLVRREHLWTQVLQKTRFSQILSFRKEAHLAVKKSLPLERVIPYPTLVWWSLVFHRCSLMVKVLCVWYYSWSGGSIFEPRFCKKTWFSQILSFSKEAHILQSKKSSSQQGYTLSNTCMVMPRFHRCSLMVKVLCVCTILGQKGASLNPGFAKKTWFSQILSFHKEAYIAVTKSLPLERVIPYPPLVW